MMAFAITKQNKVDIINKILLVGAGELGSRHLQSLVTHKRDPETREIYVYDPSEASLELSKQRVLQVVKGENVNVFYSDSLDFPVDCFNLAVVATNAAVRLPAIKDILSKFSIEYFLLEKILFQSTKSLENAEKIILSSSVKKAWVNCPRRLFPTYKNIHELITGDKVISMSVIGNNWGMACNSIHFIDLWFYLSKIESYKMDTSKLSNTIINSKRSGFKEVEGELLCKSNSSKLLLKCTSNEFLPMSTDICINTDSKSISINEIEGVVKISYFNGDNEEQLNFLSLYQSQMTGDVASSILFDAQCELTSFTESSKIHTPFLDGLLTYFKENDSPLIDFCPIT